MFGELYKTKYWYFSTTPWRCPGANTPEYSESSLDVTGWVSSLFIILGGGKLPSLYWAESKDILPCKTASGLNRQKYLLES